MKEVLKELDNMGIKYELVEHKPVYTIEDMNNLDPNIFKGAEICKNLFLRDQKGKRHFLVVLCSEKQADLSKIQETIFSSKLSFASPERLKKYLGLEPGHVSPMGLINDKENKVEVIFDKELTKKELLAVHPNTNEASLLISFKDLEKFVNEAHSYGLKTALAGSVKKEQLKPLNDIGCDVVGIRGAACVGGDRNTGKIHHTAVAELKELCDSF